MRMRVLAVQAANDTYGEEQRGMIADEIGKIQEEMGRILERATFNKVAIFSGTDALLADDFNLQVGADEGHSIAVDLENFDAMLEAIVEDLELGSVEDHDDWAGLIDKFGEMLSTISTLQAELGAYMNMLEFTIQNLDIAAENLAAAESRIRDADMAKEMMNLTQANILQQAATAMLAQANQSQQSILQLLG